MAKLVASRSVCLQDEDEFWLTVDDGDHEFMATRPLDLRWMVVLWNRRKSLAYLELIEANISNRLCEFNESYEAAGEARVPCVIVSKHVETIGELQCR